MLELNISDHFNLKELILREKTRYIKTTYPWLNKIYNHEYQNYVCNIQKTIRLNDGLYVRNVDELIQIYNEIIHKEYMKTLQSMKMFYKIYNEYYYNYLFPNITYKINHKHKW